MSSIVKIAKIAPSASIVYQLLVFFMLSSPAPFFPFSIRLEGKSLQHHSNDLSWLDNDPVCNYIIAL